MFGQITNKNGEKLYILTTVFTNEIKPFIVVDTWAKCKERLEGMTKKKIILCSLSNLYIRILMKKDI